MCVRTADLAGWHPPSLPTAPAKGIWTPKLSYQRPENGEHVRGDLESQKGPAEALKLAPMGVHPPSGQGLDRLRASAPLGDRGGIPSLPGASLWCRPGDPPPPRSARICPFTPRSRREPEVDARIAFGSIRERKDHGNQPMPLGPAWLRIFNAGGSYRQCVGGT